MEATMSSHPEAAAEIAAEFPGDNATVAPADVFYARLSSVYRLGHSHANVFASPLGPFSFDERHAWLPRFVFFGPKTTDESWRLAFVAGFDRRDLRASHALLGLVEYLAAHAHDAYGLNLTFFPLIDVAGHIFEAGGRGLEHENWALSRAPELRLLERDARVSGYHGYVRLETAPAGADAVTVRMRAPSEVLASPDVEVVSSADFEPLDVHFECGELPARDGPLSVAPDLPVPPFELTVQIPATWSSTEYQTAANVVLSRFILRYRAFQAFGLHL
jgi:hypothetical protein